MQSSSVLDHPLNVPSTEPAKIPAEVLPEWNTFEARRRRTFLFLLFAAVYVGYQLIARWVHTPLFDGDWFYFGGEKWPELPPWDWPWHEPEFAYRWFLTVLPLAAWAGILLFLLTRASFLTHRRVAFVVIVLGLIYFEGDMRWYQMSKRHASSSEIYAFFDLDASSDLGLRTSDYEDMGWQLGYHMLFLAILAFFAGPEPRFCIQAIWNGPLGRTYVGIACRWLGRALVWLRLDAVVFWILRRLDSKVAFACLVLLVITDPVVIWAFNKEKQSTQAERTVTGQIADANPLRWQSLDRVWDRVVLTWSEEGQELAAANTAMRDLESLSPAINGPVLSIPKRQIQGKPHNILILQAETLNAEVFNQTLPDLPYLSEFSKKCLRLKRHFSVANATHYGIMGLLHGSPVTFFTGPRDPQRPNPYLDHFKNNGYKTRLIARSVMSHHSLGHYLPNWTEEVSEPPGDFKCIPVIHEQLAKPGPQLVYSFYHATHFPYDHDKEERFTKFLPEVEYDFNYNRSNLSEWKEQIVNRYKNTLVNMDDWYKEVLEKVDLSNTIVVITGDHGEEFFQQGRLGHCSALTIHQTMTPCLIYIPGVEPGEVTFITSHADIMPTIADALGHEKKPATLGQSLFEPVSFRYAVVSHFDYTKCKLWAVATDDRMAVFQRDYWDNVEIVGLTDWNGQKKPYNAEAETWGERFRIIRRVEEQLRASRD